MFDTESNDVMNDSSTFDDQQFDQTTNTVVDSALDNQSDGLTDIQDSTTESKTIPYERFEDVNTRLRETSEINKKLIQLLENNNRPQQVEQEIDIIDRIIGDDMFITKDQMKEILRFQREETEKVYTTTQQSSREQALTQQEVSFRQSAPDYDAVIKNIPQKVIQSLYVSYDNPAELVQAAYSIGKSLSSTSTASALKAANLNTPAKPKAVTLQSIKGSATQTNEDFNPESMFQQRLRG